MTALIPVERLGFWVLMSPMRRCMLPSTVSQSTIPNSSSTGSPPRVASQCPPLGSRSDARSPPTPPQPARARAARTPTAHRVQERSRPLMGSLLDGHRGDDDVLEGTVAHVGLDALDGVDDLLGVLVGHLAEHGGLALQVRGGAHGDEELRPVGAGGAA